MSLLKIPVWPESKDEEVAMSFLHGEAGWYLWLLHKQGADLSRIERDMMLLYNNGDLQSFPREVSPEAGIYVCTLNEKKIIRGLVLNKYKNVAPEPDWVHLLDVDSGRVLTVPIAELKVLPTFASKAAARAVRCDLGLDCPERFSWLGHIDDMLKRSLADAQLLVGFDSERPGSIPTVSVTARLWNPSGGATIDFRDWLVRCFGPHLVINALNDYLPMLVDHQGSSREPVPAAAEPVPLTVPPGFSPLTPFLPNLFQLYGYAALPWAWPNNPTPTPTTPPTPTQLLIQTGDVAPRPLFADVEEVNGENLLMTSCSRPVLTVEALQAAIATSTPRTPETLGQPKAFGQAQPCWPKHAMASPELVQISDRHMESSPKAVEISDRHMVSSPKLVEISDRDVDTSGLLNTTGKKNEIVLSEWERNWRVGAVFQVVLSHVVSPEFFTVVVDEDAAMAYHLQQEMIRLYDGSAPLPVASKKAAEQLLGTFCVCYDATEQFWFRAEVQEWYHEHPQKPVNVWCVDFGGFYDVPLEWLRALEGSLCREAPIQSTFLTMNNIRPRQSPHLLEWPDSDCDEIRREILVVDQAYWVRIEEPSRRRLWPVSVFKDGACTPPSLNDVIVERQLGFYRRSLAETKHPSAESVKVRGEWNPMEDDYLRGQNINVDDEDACFAVSGYKPLSEAKVCRFFAAKGKCFKGLNCRQKHIPLREGGWSQEREYVYTKAFLELKLPSEGSVFKMNVTRFINVHHFVGVQVPEKAIPTEENYQMLLQHMNKPAQVSRLESLSISPALGQLVVAKHKRGKYSDDAEYWFRGRVIEFHADDDEIFEVRDVDTGVQMWLEINDLRQMNPEYLHLPFQAIECYLADMSPMQIGREFSKRGLELLRQLLRKRTVQVYVVERNINDALAVKLTTSDGQDVASVLCERGYIHKGASRLSSKNVVRYIPG